MLVLGQHVRELEPTRRHATLFALVLEAKATVIDEIVDLNDRIIGTLFNRARRHHEQKFQESGKAINEKVRLFYRVGQALLEAKEPRQNKLTIFRGSVLTRLCRTQSLLKGSSRGTRHWGRCWTNECAGGGLQPRHRLTVGAECVR